MTQSIPMLLWCPECGERHVDEGEFAEKVHHTHACQHCGHVWRPAIVATVGVRFLPGFKNPEKVVSPLSVECPTCHAQPGVGCSTFWYEGSIPREAKLTMGDYGPEFHEERRP